jgi:hypothetical protein
MLQHGVPVPDALMQQDKQGHLGQVLQVVRVLAAWLFAIWYHVPAIFFLNAF